MSKDGENLDELSDENTPIVVMRNAVREFVEERDWSKYHNAKDLAVAISVEANELLENFLFEPSDVSIHHRKEAIVEEIADVFIYLLSLVNSLDEDLTQLFYQKMAKNRKKYPLSEFLNGYWKKK